MADDRFTRAELGLVGTAALFVFSRVFGLSVVLPNFREHYESSMDPLWIGVAFGAYGLTMALMQFPNGALSDRFGRRPLLTSATILFVAGSVWAAFATDPVALVAARLLQGMGAVGSIAVAAVGEAIPAARRTRAMAMVGIPAGMGFLAGIGGGPVLYPLIGMKGLFLLTAAMGLLPGLLLLRARMPAPHHGTVVPLVGRQLPQIAALAAAGFCTNYLLTTTLFFLPDSDWRRLLPMVLVALVGIGVLSRRIDRSGWTWQPAVIALIFLGGTAALYGLTGSPWSWLGGALFFLLHAVLSTTLPSNVSRIAGPRGGRGHGIQNVVAYGGTFAAGPVAGALAAFPAVAFVVADALAVCTAVALWLVFRSPQPSKGATPGPESTP